MPNDPLRSEHKTEEFRFGIIGFYLSCAGVAIGAAIAAAGYLWFGSTGALVFGSIMTVVSSVTCFRSLVAARR
jgi:hypothetical protein